MFKEKEEQTKAVVGKLSSEFITKLIMLCNENNVNKNELIRSTVDVLKEYVNSTDFDAM